MRLEVPCSRDRNPDGRKPFAGSGEQSELEPGAAQRGFRRRPCARLPPVPRALVRRRRADDRERFLAAGADDVLSKPFRLTDLTAMVDKLVANRRAQ